MRNGRRSTPPQLAAARGRSSRSSTRPAWRPSGSGVVREVPDPLVVEASRERLDLGVDHVSLVAGHGQWVGAAGLEPQGPGRLSIASDSHAGAVGRRGCCAAYGRRTVAYHASPSTTRAAPITNVTFPPRQRNQISRDRTTADANTATWPIAVAKPSSRPSGTDEPPVRSAIPYPSGISAITAPRRASVTAQPGDHPRAVPSCSGTDSSTPCRWLIRAFWVITAMGTNRLHL